MEERQIADGSLIVYWLMILKRLSRFPWNFTNRVIPTWKLSDHVVSAETVNTFKKWLDRFWSNQDVLYDYTADLRGIGNRTVVM